MTLKFRNKLFVGFASTFIFLTILVLALVLTAAFQHKISFPAMLRFPSSGPELFNKFLIFKAQKPAVLASTFFLLFYADFTICLLIPNFKKTKSIEITFFGLFLFACVLESFRFIPYLFNTQYFSLSQVEFCSRMIVFARVLAAISFVFASISTSDSQFQYAERNLLLCFFIAALISSMIPMSYSVIYTTFVMKWGLSRSLFIFRLVAIAVTAISFFWNCRQSGNIEKRKLFLWFLHLFFGYALLVSADNYFASACGIASLIVGTSRYLHTIHQNYMWQ